MKRDEHLKTLSWEHHHGLVVAFRLQQGLKNGTSYDVLREYILYIWENDLDHHFWKEEQVLHSPLLKTEAGKKFIEQMKNEHQTFRDLIKILTINIQKTEHISTFADNLNRHIRFEERQLFPSIENESTKKELARIGKFLQEHYAPACTEWQPHFWLNPNN